MLFPKAKQFRSKKIRDSARGEDCTLRLPDCCNHNPETTVWCHGNGHEYGKGMGLKADDRNGCYGCSACHDVLDGRAKHPYLDAADIEAEFKRAMEESQAKLKHKGLM